MDPGIHHTRGVLRGDGAHAFPSPCLSKSSGRGERKSPPVSPRLAVVVNTYIIPTDPGPKAGDSGTLHAQP